MKGWWSIDQFGCNEIRRVLKRLKATVSELICQNRGKIEKA
jgi:hypothetical protein